MRQNIMQWILFLVTVSFVSAYPTRPSELAQTRGIRRTLRGHQIKRADPPPGDGCAAGAWQCNGASLQQCDHGSWTTLQCPPGLSCVSGGSETIARCAAGGQESQPPLNPVHQDVVNTATAEPTATATVSPAASEFAVSVAPDRSSELALQSPSSASQTSGVPPSTATANATSSDFAASTAISPAPKGGSASAPHYVIYTDANEMGELPSAAQLKGFNRLMLAFWMTTRGAAAKASTWMKLGPAGQAAKRAEYNAAGISVMVSAFGATDESPTSMVAEVVGQKLAAFVKTNNLDGVDIDFEGDLFNTNAKDAVKWLIDLQTTLRKELPPPYLISHAPMAPWFSPKGIYNANYGDIAKAVGKGIDFYNIQYYNDGAEYTDCTTLMTASKFIGTSVNELTAAGIGIDQIVIGKPLTQPDAGSGHMTPDKLNECMKQAKGKPGVMYWRWRPEASEMLAKAIA